MRSHTQCKLLKLFVSYPTLIDFITKLSLVSNTTLTDSVPQFSLKFSKLSVNLSGRGDVQILLVLELKKFT